jgi:hypothetical protein
MHNQTQELAHQFAPLKEMKQGTKTEDWKNSHCRHNSNRESNVQEEPQFLLCICKNQTQQCRNNSKRECNVQESARLRWIDGHYFFSSLAVVLCKGKCRYLENAAKQSPELHDQGR